MPPENRGIDSSPDGSTGSRPALEWMIVLAVILGFCDESIRKAIPGNPVLVTAVKDVLFCGVGLSVLLGSVWARKLAVWWTPWILYVMASGVEVWQADRSDMHLLSVMRTYLGPVWLMIVGSYVGSHLSLLQKVKSNFLVGTLLAVAVAGLQEVARDKLPAFLSTQILLIDGHSFAGGRYNESLFGSPQTLATCCMVAAVVAFQLAFYNRGRYDAAVCLLLFATGMYLSRIRTVLMMCPAAFLLICLLWHRWQKHQAMLLVRWVVVGCVLAGGSGLFVNLGGFDWWSRESGVDLTKESRYLEYLGESEEHSWRFIYFLTEFEIRSVPAARYPFGYGAGTSGSLRSFLSREDHFIPESHDTGIFLLVAEFGLVGLAFFLTPLVMLCIVCLRGLTLRRPPPDAVWAFASGLVFLLWFLLKSYTIMNNGFSQMLWFGSLGIAWGAVVVPICRPPVATGRTHSHDERYQ